MHPDMTLDVAKTKTTTNKLFRIGGGCLDQAGLMFGSHICQYLNELRDHNDHELTYLQNMNWLSDSYNNSWGMDKFSLNVKKATVSWPERQMWRSNRYSTGFPIERSGVLVPAEPNK